MTSIQMDPRLRARRVEVMRLQGRRRLRILATLVVGSLAVALAWWVAARSPLFDVDRVEVRGAVRTPVDDVIEGAGIEEGEPLLEVDVAAAEQAVAMLPWVDGVRSERRLDGTVVIDVTERVAVAAVPGSSGWLLVDADGRVLEAVEELEPGTVVVDGPRWKVGPGGWVGEGALGSIDVAGSLPPRLAPDVASIADRDGEISLVLFGGGRIDLGVPTALDDKFLAAMTVLAQVDTRCLDRLDVRAPTVPVLTRVPDCS